MSRKYWLLLPGWYYDSEGQLFLWGFGTFKADHNGKSSFHDTVRGAGVDSNHKADG